VDNQHTQRVDRAHPETRYTTPNHFWTIRRFAVFFGLKFDTQERSDRETDAVAI
jgi:hypothetical protein